MFDNEESERVEKTNVEKVTVERMEGAPTFAFVASSWAALMVGTLSYLIGLFNAKTMLLNEQGYYFAILMFGLYAAVSLQKAVRDKAEGISVTGIYYGISWFALLTSITLMVVGLWNAGSIILSEKGFYAMAFILSLFAAITVQKNIRDTQRAREKDFKR